MSLCGPIIKEGFQLDMTITVICYYFCIHMYMDMDMDAYGIICIHIIYTLYYYVYYM